MKRMVLEAATMAMLAGVALGGTPYPSQGDLTVSIPFEFAVGEKLMAAGDYTILAKADVKLRLCEDGIRCQAVETAPIEVLGAARGSMLIFRKSGDRWTLVQVWMKSDHGRRVMSDEMELDGNWKHAEYIEVKARPLCVHQIAGLPPSWH